MTVGATLYRMRVLKRFDAHETARLKQLEGLPLASFGSRAAAFVVDFVLAAVIFMAVGVPATILLQRAGWIAESDIMLHFDFKSWYSVVAVIVYFGLSTYFGRGKTPGKALLRIRVVSLLHARISFWHSLERALGYGASALEGGFGFIQYFVHPNHRTTHDRIAETIVVAESKGSPARR
jgi:uncharacterized RDD family membrane protein YckC